MAEGLAMSAGVKLDTAIYDRVRCFRAPNSRHPKTGLHKRRLTHAELFGLSANRIQELAQEPASFDGPVIGEAVPELEADWQEAAESLNRELVNRHERGDHVRERLQRDTLDFIKNGAEEGERHTRLFRAAAVPIVRHVKIRGQANPFDPAWSSYFARRRTTTDE